MGAQLSTVAATSTVPIDAYIAEIKDLTFSNDIGKSRFLKTVKAVHRDGLVVVKVFIKPTSVQIDISGFKVKIKELSEKLRKDLGPLNEFPNVIGYSRIVETDRAGYLIRQFIKYNLYDRISTRPFLETIEKKWIAFQILRALQTCHEHGICHGDIKCENVLIGSWKWVYLSDFAPFKPPTLPETDSAQFLFYFDTSQRRACYVAPERFTQSETEDTTLKPESDVYSSGCVIGELFLDGQPLLTLADLFKYKKGEYTPNLDAATISPEIKELIMSMISVNPKDRLSAKEYLEKYEGSVFPSYFKTYWNLFEIFSGKTNNKHNSNEMIKHIWNNVEEEILVKSLKCELRNCTKLPKSQLPVVINLPNCRWIPEKRTENPDGSPLSESGASIIISFVCAALSSTSSLTWRLKAAQLVLLLSEFVTDDTKLDICLPYLVFLLKDDQPEIKSAALAMITHLLSMVSHYSKLNAKLYSAYLLPRLQQAITPDSPTSLKVTLAVCLPRLTSYAVPCEGWPNISTQVNRAIRFLLTDTNVTVRQAVLDNADGLCAVLRKQGTNEVVLSHVITYMNDKNLTISKSFFKFITRVSPLIGPVDLEHYILPLMLESIYNDREEFELVALVLESLGAIVQLGLLKLKLLLTKIIPSCAKFLIHPNVYIRTQALLLVSATASHLSDAEIFCLLKPILSPTYLNNEVYNFKDNGSLIQALKPPLTLPVYRQMQKWALEAHSSNFWNAATVHSTGNLNTQIMSCLHSFSAEDKVYLEKLYELGFREQDMWQLIVYRPYLWNPNRISKSKDNTPLTGIKRIRDVKRMSSSEVSSTDDSGQDSNSNTSNTPFSNVNTISSLQISPAGNDVNLNGIGYIMNINSKQVGKSLQSMMIVPKQNNGTAIAGSGQAKFKLPLKPKDHKPSIPVASIKAHRGAIHVLATHSNQRLFITGADDGMVKLWDTQMLLKGSSRPMASFLISERITAGYFLLDSSVIAIGTASGKVKFLDCRFKSTDNNFVFDNLVQVGEFQLPSSCAIKFHAISSKDNGEDAVNLWILISENKAINLNLSDFTISYEFIIPASFGPSTCWLWDIDNSWVIIGTLHGMISLFDTRFRLRLQSWGVGDLKPINDIAPHPIKQKWICIAGGFERDVISIWDLHKLECRELLVPMSLNQDPDHLDLNLSPIMESQQLLEEKFASWNINSSLNNPFPVINSISVVSYPSGNNTNAGNSTNQTSPGHPNANNSDELPASKYLLSGGSDRVLRCWNILSPHESFIISSKQSLRNAKVHYTGKVGVSMRYIFEQQTIVKRSDKHNSPGPSSSSVSGYNESDEGRVHNGAIINVAYLQTSADLRDMAISVDEVGVIKVFS